MFLLPDSQQASDNRRFSDTFRRMSLSPRWSRSRRNSQTAPTSRHAPSNSMSHLDVPAPPAPRPSMHRSHSTNAGENSSMRGMQRLEAVRQMEERNFRSASSRRKILNPPVDLRALDYVSPCDENLMCAICRCPFVDPVVLSECDHCFCRDCIRQTWQSSYTPVGPRGACPSCRTQARLGPRSATSKILTNILDDLVVKCPKNEEGCKAQVKRGEVQDHVNIYCGYSFMECPAEECELPVRRKDATEGCLHYDVSCPDCHDSMPKSNLETHWKAECRSRKVHCGICKEAVFHDELDMHSRETCPAISIPCPGKAIGCTAQSKRTQAEVHAKSCTFAKLAPVLQAQTERLNEQEAAQKLMSRKLEVLENGFGTMQQMMYPRSPLQEGILVEEESANESRIPFLNTHSRMASAASDNSGMYSAFEFPASPSSRPPTSATTDALGLGTTTHEPSAASPTDEPESFTTDFDLASPFPPPTANGPFVSPLHHLLSMHESLRDEMSRISSALQELDGRHSMHNLNENLRTREEITYLGAQVAGLSRQVHWLTSAQLQRQSRAPTPSASAVAGSSDIAGAGAGVEAAVSAVSTAATALRGAARIVNVGQSSGSGGMGMRRAGSEEGRTKL